MTVFIGNVRSIPLTSDFNVTNFVDIYRNMTATMDFDDLAEKSPFDERIDGKQVQFVQFIVLGIIGTIIAVLGFLGNTLSMIVLQQRKMRSTTSYYLFSLAVYDNFVLFGMLIYFILPALAPYIPLLADTPSMINLTIPLGYPLSLSAQMASIYTCVGFTVERFIAVCRPLHVANTCTKKRTMKAIMLILFWSMLYNIPRFFQYELHYITSNTSEVNTGNVEITVVTPCGTTDSFPCAQQTNGLSDHLTSLTDTRRASASNTAETVIMSTNVFQDMVVSVREEGILFPGNIALTASESGHTLATAPKSTASLYTPVTPVTSSVVYRPTAFGNDQTFQHVYLIYSQLIFMFLLPFIIILTMNIGLIRAVKKSQSNRMSMSASASKENNLTMMLISVIVVFLVCQFPTIIDNILVAVIGMKELKKNFTYMCFYAACCIMVEINSASNFLLYCFFGNKFRTTFLSTFVCKRKRHHVAYRSEVSRSRTADGTRIYDMELPVL